ncbi:hypothetical protein VOLCADRAFT_89508 [Volvox carteri f. nagariensis]|uniref:ACT domain-containing protein n=1 Tax=Volvox carteri f. nagariensis TaxID=3068 RepID=D8TS11_VOLCA|nr:uncharacterized protein VOLCADRAFT_89508 [Volvox carteri f. nagariensis]EFJ49612.1 hypothetical protein VOLCADRAFT_89508 [Volvox carteri f. nagariensis]|eukprot:XP_002949119.1 hypothetical protein VOLCADRAFT_89508 [Volvox carteri f. nagariensis]
MTYPPYMNMSRLRECLTALVDVDNESHPLYTVLTVQALPGFEARVAVVRLIPQCGPDTPGLLRVLSWVLNGMSVRVQHGLLETTPEGNVRDSLWVTDFRGKKLKDASAESLRSRLEDFLIVCGTEVAVTTHEWRCGAIEVSNNAHPELTQVIVRGEPSAHKPGFLLELTTALTGVGASIVSGAIQGGVDGPLPESAVAEPSYDFRQGRYFKFMLRGPAGGQMDSWDADRVASLIFVLRLLEGKGSMPTVAPNMDALLREAAYGVTLPSPCSA